MKTSKLRVVGLGALGSLIAAALFSLLAYPHLAEAHGAGMIIIIMLIGPALGVVSLVLGTVAGLISPRISSSRWGVLVAGSITGFFAAAVTYILVMVGS